MRERRVFMLLGIVLAVLALGIAYAAVSRELEITGNATGNFDPANFQVKFSKVSEVTGTNGVNTTGSTATIDSTDPTKGTFSFNGFTTKGQTQSATWTISNENDAGLYAHIEMNTDTEINKEHFKATCNLADDVLDPNETTTVTVTVECIKTPEGNVDSGEMIFGFTATSSHEGKPLITFTVDSDTEYTEYQAEEGMTWEELCNSSYNKGNFSIDGELVLVDGHRIELSGFTDVWVLATDTISSGGVYYFAMGLEGL